MVRRSRRGVVRACRADGGHGDGVVAGGRAFAFCSSGISRRGCLRAPSRAESVFFCLRGRGGWSRPRGGAAHRYSTAPLKCLSSPHLLQRGMCHGGIPTESAFRSCRGFRCRRAHHRAASRHQGAGGGSPRLPLAQCRDWWHRICHRCSFPPLRPWARLRPYRHRRCLPLGRPDRPLDLPHGPTRLGRLELARGGGPRRRPRAPPDRLYLALGTYAQSWAGNGAVLRSEDRGTTWTRTDLTVKLGGNEDGRGAGRGCLSIPGTVTPCGSAPGTTGCSSRPTGASLGQP